MPFTTLKSIIYENHNTDSFKINESDNYLIFSCNNEYSFDKSEIKEIVRILNYWIKNKHLPNEDDI